MNWRPFSMSSPPEEDKNFRWLIQGQVGGVTWITVGGEDTKEEAIAKLDQLRDGKRRFRIKEQPDA